LQGGVSKLEHARGQCCGNPLRSCPPRQGLSRFLSII
jgi:hypothetical protein